MFNNILERISLQWSNINSKNWLFQIKSKNVYFSDIKRKFIKKWLISWYQQIILALIVKTRLAFNKFFKQSINYCYKLKYLIWKKDVETNELNP